MSDNIRAKLTSLSETGLSDDDCKKLASGYRVSRLEVAWRDIDETKKGLQARTSGWREKSAQKAYRAIQDISVQLFLAVVLTTSPDKCARDRHQIIRQAAAIKKNDAMLRWTLDRRYKIIFESQARDNKYSTSLYYVKFMRTMFLSKEPTLDKDFVLSQPSTQQLEEVFPQWSHAISRVQSSSSGALTSAVVKMVFPEVPGCTILIGIDAAHVATVADKMYRIDFETREKKLWWSYQKGSIAIIRRDGDYVVVDEVVDARINSMFASRVGGAMNNRTVVTMRIPDGDSGNEEKHAELELQLGLEEGIRIAKILHGDSCGVI